ncbi:hypothetical protein vseg_019300 [Gypsophila vaccaria]
MLYSTSIISSFPNEIITNFHYSRRFLIEALILHSPPPTTTMSPSPINDHNDKHFRLDKNVIMVLSLLICAIICSLFITSMIKCAIKCSCLLNVNPNSSFLNRNNNQKLNTGVDKRALKTFPVVKYTTMGNIIQGLSTECAICISEFKNGEKVKILPKCHHGFHVKCIGKWLSSHSSCPTCRQSLVDTCQKIIGSDHPQAATSSSYVEVITREVIAISILPLERETMVTNYR